MIARTRKARGWSRLVVLSIVVVAVLLAWLMFRQRDGSPPGEAAHPGAAPAYDAPDAKTPGPAAATSADPATVNDTRAAPPAAAASLAAVSPGIDVKSDPAPPAAPPGAPGSAAPTAAAGPGDAKDGEDAFPRYWRRCFRDPGAAADYRVVSDPGTAWSGSRSARVSSLVASPRSPGAGVCQVIAATSIKGRRVRLTLHMRTSNAVPGAHMLFRAEGGDGRVLAFYNMEPRWVSGTQDWAAYSAVLDVPEQSAVVMFGGSLVNAGTLWIDDALIEIVGRDVAVTQGPPPGVQYNPVVDPASLSRALQNPGFEQAGTGHY